MSILSVNCKANLLELLADKPSGVNREYILEHNNATRLGQLVLYSSLLIKNNITPYIEVKFVSKYSKREKRIELITKEEKKITIYKVSSFSKYDKDALELVNIITEIQEKFTELDVYGVLLFAEKKTNIDFINKSLKTITKNVTGEYI